MAHRVVEAGADRAYRRSNGPGDLFDLEVAVVAKDDSNPLIRVEILEGALEGIAILELSGGVMRVSVRSCPIQRVVSSVASPAKPVSAGVGEDAPEPGVQAVEIAELRKLAPGSSERVVGRIFGLLGVAKDEAGQAVGLVEARVDQGLVGGDARRIGRCRDGSGILPQPGPLVFAAVRYTCTDAPGGSRIQSTPIVRHSGRMSDALDGRMADAGAGDEPILGA
jgi:hypothetical protein